MTNNDDMIIREAAREICAAEAKRQGLGDTTIQTFLKGTFDKHPWMRLVEQGIRKGIEIVRAL